ALCALNGWGDYEVMLGEKPKPLNKDQAERDVHLKNAGANLSKDYFIREYGLQDGDLVEQTQTAFNQFSAVPRQAFNFKASANKL
ncbi:hypothetical protein NL389_37745, partial [Klebsiella pneumoniae]|nr:hypothetical protein [Klebsiella pneumoniae]